LRSIPLIMISALDHEADLIRGLDAGAQDYITKPFNNKLVMARVRSAARTKAAYDKISEINEQFDRSLLRLAALRRIDRGDQLEFRPEGDAGCHFAPRSPPSLGSMPPTC